MEHTFKQYDRDLDLLRRSLLEMGGLVEGQMRDAITAFASGSRAHMDQVAHNEQRVNRAEVDIADCCNQMIAKRQPAAGDLRLIVAIIQVVTDLERIGDEAEKIARMSRQVHGKGRVNVQSANRVFQAAEASAVMLNRALDAFARLDADVAVAIIREDIEIDAQFRAIMRELVSYMMEDPRTISTALDIAWIAKAVERIGDHAKNVAEHVIFIVRGIDVRHAPQADAG